MIRIVPSTEENFGLLGGSYICITSKNSAFVSTTSAKIRLSDSTEIVFATLVVLSFFIALFSECLLFR